MRWLLLVLTATSVWLTIDAIRWNAGFRNVPWSAISRLWPGGLDYLLPAERQRVRDRLQYSILGFRRLPPLFACVTLVLCVATAREFFQ